MSTLSNAFPTYIPEVDQKILLDADDSNLFRSCNLNPYVQSICDDERFWRDRTRARYAKLMKFYKTDTTWKAFYRRLVNDAVYVVGTNNLKPTVHSNIDDAYNTMWKQLSSSYPQLSREQILTVQMTEGMLMEAFIKLMYKDEVSAVDDEYLLYDIREPAQDILEYPELPALNLRGRQLFYYEGGRFKLEYDPQLNRTFSQYDETSHNEFRGIFDYTEDILRSFLKYTPPYIPEYPHQYINNFYILTMDSGDSGIRLIPFKYGYRAIAAEDDGNRRHTEVLLVDTSLFGRSEGFQEFEQQFTSFPKQKALQMMEKEIEKYYNEQ